MTTSELEQRAEAWVRAVHPHADHLVTARDWAVRLDPEARAELRMAALLHDIERAFPDPEVRWDPAEAWDDPVYLRWHQDRSAEIASRWLTETGTSPDFIADVARLVRVHEDGGWREADVLQAADSLSFFETVTGVTIGWVRAGAAPERASAKLQYMADRVGYQPAADDVRRLLAAAMAELKAGIGAPSTSDV